MKLISILEQTCKYQEHKAMCRLPDIRPNLKHINEVQGTPFNTPHL
ncbi:hypothetical protein [uncultured Bacteroides sp.]|nr:hypothetical protein [uncultured Bacteroides sp.]